MAGPDLRSWKVRHEVDALLARQEAERFARELGLGAKTAWQIAITVSELATNALRFAGGGTVAIRRLTTPAGDSLEIVADDSGPGIPDVDLAVIDGYSEGRFLTPDDVLTGRKGLGAGLGAVKRMMDEVVIVNKPGGGLLVTARKRIGMTR